jgi:hypothetical protein
MEALDSALPCRLDGHDCPGFECPFWIAGECLLANVELQGRPEVAAWLLAFRRDLAAREDGLDCGHVRR